jgi:NADH-quinone oxidoreductase subunit F
MPKLKSAAELEKLRQEMASKAQKKKTVSVTNGTDGRTRGSPKIIEALNEELNKQGLDQQVSVKSTGCHGFCEEEPTVLIFPEEICYVKVKNEDVPSIVQETLVQGKIVERLLYRGSNGNQPILREAEIPFYQRQSRIILGNNRLLDMESINDYIALGGYAALAKALFQMAPDAVLNEVKKANLRGRGGGGFPTGRKWAECRDAPGDEKYVICNADEGDPGAYMDRCLLEGNPHLVLEGMITGAYAIGATKGYIYVRNEYPLAVKHARIAVEQARKLGLLGDNILGSSFSFDVDIARGGGAFVCGESTALMAALEGKVGEPRPKDVHTVVDGLWHKPTTLNNVETWANVPSIILNGANWFASRGTKGSKGTKIFALTGRIKNTGLVEVAMGMPLRTIVFDIGGGAPNGKSIKAVQTGGPSGGCLPVDKFDLPLDFDLLYEAGSMIGSGGMVVMDEDSCMVDVAKYFLTFLQDESCGKCVPCRLGIDRMLEIITDITEGRGVPEQIDLLADLADTVRQTSLCALGKTAANPVLSTLRYFREEYEAHIKGGKCPAGVCKALIEYSIDPEKCNGCGVCKRGCIYGAISGKKKEVHVINNELCQKCGICQSECKFDAVQVK